MLDSGGYESSRIGYYAGGRSARRWDFSKYARIADLDIYDFIFSYDYFLRKSETKSSFIRRLLREFRRHADVLDSTKLIPVIHLRSVDGRRVLTHEESTEVFGAVVAETKCKVIAVPERELGSGITSRAILTRRIVSEVQKNSRDCFLHILGCGNLLSFSMLAVAGAMMCDGLEWCRTFAADNFHLHHFQQKDVFADPHLQDGNQLAEYVLSGVKNYSTVVAVRNLLSFQSFTRHLHKRLSQGKVHEFVGDNFGGVAGSAIRELEL